MVEDTLLKSTQSDGSDEELEVEALAQVSPGENVRKPGSDVRKGDLVLEKGQILHASGGEIGTLVFVGKTKVRMIVCVHECVGASTGSHSYCIAAGFDPSEAYRRDIEYG